MANMFEVRFNQTWSVVYTDALKPLANVQLLKLAKTGRENTLRALQLVGKAMDKRDSMLIHQAVTAARTAIADFRRSIEQFTKTAGVAVAPAYREYLTSFRIKLGYLAEDLDDAIGAVQAGTLFDLAGEALFALTGTHKITRRTVGVLADAKKAGLHPITGKALPAAQAWQKRALEHYQSFEKSMKSIAGARDKKTDLAKGKALLVKALDEAIHSLKQIEDCTQEWLAVMDGAMGKDKTQEKLQQLENLKTGVMSLKNIASKDQDDLVAAQKIAEKLGRKG